MKKVGTILASLSILAVVVGCTPRPDKSKNKDKDDAKVEEAESPRSSDTLSRWVRANSKHYWTYMKQNAAASALAPYLPYEGVIAGDPHIANFSVLPVQLLNGETAMRYVNIDFDDAGKGPFALDFARLVITTKATKHQIKTRELVEAYVRGINGETMEPPKEVARLLKITVPEYQKLAETFVDSKTEKKKFKLKPGKIEAYDGPIKAEAIKSLFPDKMILQLALRPNEDGGSRESLRLWVLTMDAKETLQIFELKQWEPSSLSSYTAQPEGATWLSEVRATFWPDLSGSTYDLVSLGEHGRFWLREKKQTLVDVPYSSQKQAAIDYVREIASYEAYVLGRAHGGQVGASGLRGLLATEAARGAFKEALKLVIAEYLGVAADREPLEDSE